MAAKVMVMKIEGKEEGREAKDDQPQGTLEKSKLDWFFSEIFPIRNFHSLFSERDVMNLRRVCRDWSMTIDNLLELANELKEPDYNNYKSIISSPVMLAFKSKDGAHTPLVLQPCLNHSSEVARFWSGSQRHERNPFLSRKAYFHCYTTEDDERYFWNHAGAILNRFGEELRSMSIWFQSQLPPQEMFRMVQECISQTPHLTQLDCFLINEFPQGAEPSGGVVLPEFPPLPNLTRLEVSFMGCPIFQQLTVYFEQLVSLNVRIEEEFMDLYNPELHSTFPSLRHLAVAIKDEVALFKLHSLTSQLREVDLRGIHTDNYCPSVYFRVLEHFKGTLCAVKIDLNFDCDDEDYELLSISTLAKLDLPNLKVLCLTVKRCGFGGLDSILMLTNPPDYLEIEVLPCHCDLDLEDEEEEESIQTHPFVEDMYGSNIWVLVPSLKELVMELGDPPPGREIGGRDRYTRREYEAKQQQQQVEANPTPAKRPRGICEYH